MLTRERPHAACINLGVLAGSIESNSPCVYNVCHNNFNKWFGQVLPQHEQRALGVCMGLQHVCA
jgi:hypothetical protein